MANSANSAELGSSRLGRCERDAAGLLLCSAFARPGSEHLLACAKEKLPEKLPALERSEPGPPTADSAARLWRHTLAAATHCQIQVLY